MPIAEGTWVLDAGLRARGHLQNDGAQVVMTRTTGADPALATRASILNSNNVHLAISIHSNAAGASAVGMETIYCDQNPFPSNSQTLANRLRERSLSMVHNQNRGTKECLAVGRGFHFYIVRGTLNMPGALSEYYFHTNLWENSNIHNTTTGRENVGRSLYSGVCDYYGVTPTFEPPPPPSTTFSADDWVRTTSNPTLNLRAGPGTNHDVLGSLPFHTVVQIQPHNDNGILATSNHWWYVEVHPTGERGWLAEVFLEATSSPGEPSVELVVDNDDPGFSASASWDSATWASNKHGPDYRVREVESTSDRASWTADLPFSGSYQVFAWWNSDTNRSPVAPYAVEHAGGNAVVTVNQRENGGKWNLLGTYDFNAGPARVLLSCWTSNTGSDVVIADAVRFVTYDEGPEPELYALTTHVVGSGAIQRIPDAAEYGHGEVVSLLAVPEPGYEFTGWSGGNSSSSNSIDLTMNGPLDVTATFARTFLAWRDQYFTESERADEGISGDNADPAGDSVPNLLKYALGLDPLEPARDALPSPDLRTVPGQGDARFLTLSFSHPSDVTDVSYVVQLSGDLSDWSETAVLAEDNESEGVTTRTYRDVSPYDASIRRFIRLRIAR